MATKKRKKTKKQEEQAVLLYIYSLVAIAISLIGLLQVGVIGEILTALIHYVVGNLYYIVYISIILYSIMKMAHKKLSEIPRRYLVSFVLFSSAYLLYIGLIDNKNYVGMDIITSYLKNSQAIFSETIIQNSGIVGALLVSLSSFLFGHIGTWIMIVLLLIIAIILAFGKYLKKAFMKTKDANEERKEKKRIKQKSLAEVEKELTLDERIAPGNISFDDNQEELFPVEVDIFHESTKQEGILADNPIEHNHSAINDETFQSAYSEDYSSYKLPKLSLLKEPAKIMKSNKNIQKANENGRRLIEILDQFGVKATLIGTHIGPSVTKFEIKPDLGVRVNRISNLQYDIKMALAARDIRIEAPIPGRAAVGIEIPNAEKTLVHMKELLRQVPIAYEHSKTLFALGKDLMGNCIFGELEKMPHLLIAGATGSGKSVCVNSIITSILMRARPDEVKMLLIDPKKVEFSSYKNIPHLLGPVIIDGEEANRALKVIVDMMDKRYESFSKVGVRNIKGYHQYISAHPEEELESMPWVIVVIDELADLMLVAAKEVEASIQRITQLARAAGIHLIVATQRPSVDVITGVIKANIPSRIAFAVSSAVDSRTILDQMGAEKLLGYGDMLYIPVGETTATRVQGVFVSDDEVQAICNHVSKQAKAKYSDAFLRLEVFDETSAGVVSDSNDPLYEEVKQYVAVSRRASTSLIQRKFSIGYARAARLIDVLEESGLIGPANGSKPREVYMKNPIDEED